MADITIKLKMMQHLATSVITSWRAMYPWCVNFDDCELAEIILAIHYRDDFQHGTSGHLGYLTIAKLFDVIMDRK